MWRSKPLILIQHQELHANGELIDRVAHKIRATANGKIFEATQKNRV